MFTNRTEIDGNVAMFSVLRPKGEFYVLSVDGSLWHEVPPFGPPHIPPARTLVASNVAYFNGASAGFVWVLDTSKNLWLYQAAFGATPAKRTQVDGNVKAFAAVSPGSDSLWVLGTNGALWFEVPPFGTIPPTRTKVDDDVLGFETFGPNILVLGSDGSLWIEEPPFGNIPPKRTKVDGNVSFFLGGDSTNTVWVLGKDGNLWFEKGPFGSVPPDRVHIDGNVMLPSPFGQVGIPYSFAPFGPDTSSEVMVLGSNRALWLEGPPFGSVPPPNRFLIDENVRAFSVYNSTEVAVLGTDGKLWVEFYQPQATGTGGTGPGGTGGTGGTGGGSPAITVERVGSAGSVFQVRGTGFDQWNGRTVLVNADPPFAGQQTLQQSVSVSNGTFSVEVNVAGVCADAGPGASLNFYVSLPGLIGAISNVVSGIPCP
jgi:hypothetical protein